MQSIPCSDDEEERAMSEQHQQHHQQRQYHSARSPTPTTTFEFQDQDIPLPRPPHDQLLSLWQGILLVTAECVGVGILALPHNVHTLGGDTAGGVLVGLGFLILNLPINFVAGHYLSGMAMSLELETKHNGNKESQQPHEQEWRRQGWIVHAQSEYDDEDDNGEINDDYCRREVIDNENNEVELSSITSNGRQALSTTTVLSSLHHQQSHDPSIFQQKIRLEEMFQDEPDHEDIENARTEMEEIHGSPVYGSIISTGDTPSTSPAFDHEDEEGNNNKTQDLVAMSRSIFQSRHATFMVTTFYYVNLFLVLGDYILVMGRAVSAITLDWISCAPLAGAVAAILMLGICQFRTMATLGRKVSLASLLAILVVILQCLFHHRASSNDGGNDTTVGEQATTVHDNDNSDEEQHKQQTMNTDIWSKFSAMAGIGFAVGSQKLFLNVRHELRHKEESSKVLAGSLTTYGSAYILVILLAGSSK